MSALKVTRTGAVLRPDTSRVFFRPFALPNRERLLRTLARVSKLSEERVQEECAQMMQAFAERHQRLQHFLLQRFEEVSEHLISDEALSESRKLLIGAYLTLEYSLEAAALFNPSIVAHPDQTGMPGGRLRLVLSLRATGEGHLSSIVFRTAEVDQAGQVSVNPPTRYVAAVKPDPHSSYEKKLFERKLAELDLFDPFAHTVLAGLEEIFTADHLKRAIELALRRGVSVSRDHQQRTAQGILAVMQANYELHFDPDSRLSERVLFPNTPAENRGIEDARWVAFQNDEGGVDYYATYSAFDGHIVLPQIIETRDFLNFRISTLNGPEVRNKGLALFPRKIDGHFAMLSRQDGENVFIMFSDLLHFWHEKQLLLRPTEPWEFVQLGNCGSPIETEAGWLVLTHGVGPMRRYVISAVLLDRDNPRRVIGRLRSPLLSPTEAEREGYVPNVVYSCGSLVHAGNLILPYAMSDQCTGFATIPLAALLDELKRHPPPTA